jgi:hypothetical protein
MSLLQFMKVHSLSASLYQAASLDKMDMAYTLLKERLV